MSTDWTDEEKALAAGMRRSGMTAKQIAARLGCTPSEAARRCRKLGAYARLDHKPGRRGAPVGALPHKEDKL